MAVTKMGPTSKSSNRRTYTITLTAVAAGTDTETTAPNHIKGDIKKIVLDTAALKNAATVQGYETNSVLGTPEKFLNFTSASGAQEHTIYPLVAAVNNANGALTTATSVPYSVDDTLTFALAGANEGEVVTLVVYVGD